MRSGKQLVKNLLLFSAIYLVKVDNIHAQCSATSYWNYSSSGITNTRGQDITKDHLGNVYVSGTFEGSSSNFPNPASCPVPISGPNPGAAAYVAKYDPCGNLLWINYDKGLGESEGRTVVVDSLSGGDKVFVAGWAKGDVMFNSTAAIPCVPASGGSAVSIGYYYIASFNRNTGAWIATYNVPTPAGYSTFDITSMAYRKFVLPVGPGIPLFSLYLCGSAIETSTGLRKAMVSHITSNDPATTFNHSWTRMATGTGTSQCLDIIHNSGVAAPGNISVTGDFRTNMAFAPLAAITSPAIQDGFVCSFDIPTGNALTHLRFNVAPNQSASGTALTHDGTGDPYCTGWYTGNVPLPYGTGAALPGISAQRRTYIMKMNSSFTVGWDNCITNVSPGENISTGIAIANNTVYAYGMFVNGDINIGGYLGPYISISANQRRLYVASVARSTGALIYGNTTEYPFQINEHVSTRIVAKNGFLYSTGYYKGGMDYDHGSTVPLMSPSFGNFEMFVLRNDANAVNNYMRPGQATGVDEVALSDKIVTVFPNPAGDNVSLTIAGADNKDMLIALYDVTGKKVQSQSINYQGQVNIDLNGLEKGVYFIQISGDDMNYKRKIVKN